MPGMRPCEAKEAKALNWVWLAGLYAMLAFSCTYSKDEKNQSLSFLIGPPDGGYIVLPREWLFRIGSWIFDWEARVKRRRSFIKSSAAMPLVRASLGSDHN